MRHEFCLLCQKPIFESTSLWNYLVSCDMLCERCRSSLKKIDGIRMLTNLPVRVLYDYNTDFQKCIIQYKECYDEALASMFLYDFKSKLKRKYKNAVLIPMPSSIEKKKERGFDHVEKMFECLDLQIIHCLYKTENYDQKMQNKLGRSHIHDIMRLNENIILPDKKIILIDDICTSGSTLVAAYELLKEKSKNIEACVLASRAETVGKKRRKKFEKQNLRNYT